MAVEWNRRRFLGAFGGGLAATAVLGPTRGQLTALAAATDVVDGYGPLGPADGDGVRLPDGFSARVIARSGDPVPGTDFRWHQLPDGGACFPQPGGGHAYVSNSELGNGLGGVSVVRFDADGRIGSADTILSGTSRNCSGGATPWGTWLSCEENGSSGQVWECDPNGGAPAVRPRLGSFNHEAAAVDEPRRQIFLTEDNISGRLYRFRPRSWPDLDDGDLEAAVVDDDGAVTWVAVASYEPSRDRRTRAFNGGEGAVVVGDRLFFATKGDRRIWEYDLIADRIWVFHDCLARRDTALTDVDNLAVHPITGDLFVAEDDGDMDLCLLVPFFGSPVVSRMVRFEGHAGSEVAGPAFSPDGRFLYVSSQRGTDGRGMTFQITGPFVPPRPPPRRPPSRLRWRPI